MIARAAGKHMARVLGYAAVPILLAPLLGPVIAGAIGQPQTETRNGSRAKKHLQSSRPEEISSHFVGA
jgi:hypothetical protein